MLGLLEEGTAPGVRERGSLTKIPGNRIGRGGEESRGWQTIMAKVEGGGGGREEATIGGSQGGLGMRGGWLLGKGWQK